jgi:hypothetical protein
VWARVTGACPLTNATTDELIQWAAAKWGLSDEIVRAQMIEESNWYQNLKWTNTMPPGLGARPSGCPIGTPVFGRGYGDYAPGASSIPSSQGSPNTSPGSAYNSALGNTLVDTSVANRQYGPASFGMPQCKWWSNTSPGPLGFGAYPYTETCTSVALDVYCATLRAQYEGMNAWMAGSGGDPTYASYAASPGGTQGVWGSIGNWFSGDWASGTSQSTWGSTITGAIGYCKQVQAFLSAQTWLGTSFYNPQSASPVGAIGTVAAGSTNTALSVFYGTGATVGTGRTGVLWVIGTGTNTFPTTPGGWSVLDQAQGTNCSISLFVRETAPADGTSVTIAALASTTWQGQLGLFQGVAGTPLDQHGHNNGTASPVAATAGAADSAIGDLIVAGGVCRAAVGTATTSNTMNSGVTNNDTANDASSSAIHYRFTWGVATDNGSADSVSFATNQGTIQGLAVAIASLKTADSNVTGSAVLSTTDTRSTAAKVAYAAAASLTATAALHVAGPGVNGAATLSSTSSLAASASVGSSVSLSTTSALAAGGSVIGARSAIVGAASFTSTVTQSTAGLVTLGSSVSLSATETLSNTAVVAHVGQSTLSMTESVAVGGALGAVSSTSMAATSAMSTIAAGVLVAFSADLSATTTLTATSTTAHTGEADLATESDLTVVAEAGTTSASFGSSSAMTAGAVTAYAGTVSENTTSTLASVAKVTASGSASLSAGTTLATNATMALAGKSDFVTTGLLSASATGTIPGSVSFTTTATLGGAANASYAGGAGLGQSSSLSSDSSIGLVGASSLSSTTSLFVLGGGQGTGSASLSTTSTMSVNAGIILFTYVARASDMLLVTAFASDREV